MVSGAIASVFPLIALASDERCSGACDRYQSSSNAVAWGALGVSTALLASGVAVLWTAPFGRRQQGKADVSIGVGSIHLKGSFQ